ncbi:hypothetical protein [Anaeromyxobacter oryzae]|uniref:Uncharacterized protein n=1 Tax=Anaeromyxobacter oryzae TaxID=2918170 RepID=A0ABM7WRY4_9BACT|nr:hypothetical protein [Anaeromyxobacter oryzae]BDG02234.1 hypothetical protein AMOR_12300 [Anaeromyxobacter oryzae]
MTPNPTLRSPAPASTARTVASAVLAALLVLAGTALLADEVAAAGRRTGVTWTSALEVGVAPGG